MATTVKGIYVKEPETQCNEALAQALNLDMTAWWSVSGDSYLDHVSKASAAAPIPVGPAGRSIAAPFTILGKIRKEAVNVEKRVVARHASLSARLGGTSRESIDALPFAIVPDPVELMRRLRTDCR